jgi:uncharacterized protein
VVRTREFDDPQYLSNPLNRCYFCKHALFREMEPVAREGGFRVLVYGENASDVGDHRPGAMAAGEFDVRAPLREAGLTKPEIRELSARLGLPSADKPQMACLSSRIPTGEAVTEAKLGMIEAGESFLRELDFHDVRVRHHEMPGGAWARIELGRWEMGRLLGEDLLERVVRYFQEVGYRQVTLDLAGYRRGSTNGVKSGNVHSRAPGAGLTEETIGFRSLPGSGRVTAS